MVPKASQPRRWRGCDRRRGEEGGEKNELDAARAQRGARQPRRQLALGAGLGVSRAREQEVERRHGGGGQGIGVGLFYSHARTLAEDLRFMQLITSKYSVKMRQIGKFWISFLMGSDPFRKLVAAAMLG